MQSKQRYCKLLYKKLCYDCRADYGLMEKLLKEKEQIIAELLEEGTV